MIGLGSKILGTMDECSLCANCKNVVLMNVRKTMKLPFSKQKPFYFTICPQCNYGQECSEEKINQHLIKK